MNNHKKPWTKAQLVRLKQLNAAGISHRKVASILGRAVGAIVPRLQIINTASMINDGDDGDTLISWKKKLKENV